ncbi:MAG: hypothetical protein WBH40_09785, partial [Ignavibacteriaceae bacterium]
MKRIFTIISILVISSLVLAQQDDSVDVTFFYYPDNNPNTVYLPGEFNGWTLNSASMMTFDPVSESWFKTFRLRVGGPDPLPVPFSVPGAYQYKINADNIWLQDPLNPRENPNDNNNSFLFIRNPVIHLLLPNSTPASGIIRSRFPEISAYIFPSISSGVDTSTIILSIDGVQYLNLGSSYDQSEKKLSFIPPNPLGDGEHELILFAQSTVGTFSADTATFTIQSGAVQFLTLDSETWKESWQLQGAIFSDNGGYDTTVTSAQIIRSDSTWDVQVVNGIVDTSLHILEGDNYFKLQAEVGGQTELTDSLLINHKVNHVPYAQIDITQNGSTLTLSGANSTD